MNNELIERMMEEVRLEVIFAESWIDLSNRLFNPVDGIVSRVFPERSDRERFILSEEYQEIRKLLNQQMARSFEA